MPATTATLMCGPWRKAAELGTAHSVIPERVLIEYNEDLILIYFSGRFSFQKECTLQSTFTAAF